MIYGTFKKSFLIVVLRGLIPTERYIIWKANGVDIVNT